jgi:Protein of unknown function (DUF2490)
MSGRRCWHRAAWKIAFFLLLLSASRPAKAAPSCSHSGGQTWEYFNATHSLSEHTSLALGGSMRTNCGFGGFNPYNGRGAVGIRWRPLKHLEIYPAYTFLAITPGPAKIHEISLEISAVDLPIGRWAIQENNKIEEDFRPSGSTTRYSNELELSRPMRLGRFRLVPFAAEYLKYDLHRRGWNYTRLMIGASKSLTKKLSLQIYYARTNGSHFSPGITNALVTQFNLRF